MTMYLRRRAVFNAGIAGIMGAVPGGHNYVCELCVAGEIDGVTGMVVNITDVDAVLKAKVVHRLDRKILDRDVPEFADRPITPTTIAQFVWSECGAALPPACVLSGVIVCESPNDWSTLERRPGTVNIMQTVTRAYEFSASHRLHAPALGDDENARLFGKCNWINGHGHNYEFEVTVRGDVDAATGWIINPDVVDEIVEQEILKAFDHRHLNLDIPEFADVNPTSENLTRVIWDRLDARWRRDNVGPARLYRVIVRETPRNYFEYYGPNDGT